MSGIWPPDVGGPASHAPEVAEMLLSRGHEVEVVTTADRAPALEAYPVHWASRSLPRGVRHARAVQLIAVAARRADVVYSTGMLGRSALGSALVHAPIVQKLTSDPTYERSIRSGRIPHAAARPPSDSLGIRILDVRRSAMFRAERSTRTRHPPERWNESRSPPYSP